MMRYDWKTWSVVIFLAVNSWRDIRRKEIFLGLTILYIAIGILCGTLQDGISFWNGVLSVLPGCFLLLLARLSNEKVGYGDGISVVAVGVWSGFTPCFLGLTAGLLIAAVWCAFLLLFCRAKRKDVVPFIPFLTVGYIGGLLLVV